MRKLVSIRKITELHPIPDADIIERAKIDGWNVVVKKVNFVPVICAFTVKLVRFFRLPTGVSRFSQESV